MLRRARRVADAVAHRRQPDRLRPGRRADWLARHRRRHGADRPRSSTRGCASDASPARGSNARRCLPSRASSSRCRQTSDDGWEYTVSWIDCSCTARRRASRHLLRANHAASRAPAPPPPSGACRSRRRCRSSTACRCAPSTSLYFQRHRAGAERSARTLLPFFYPLDALLRVEPHLWPARLLPVPVRGAGACEADAIAELLQAIAAAARLLPGRPQDLRRRDRRPAC